MTKEQPEVKTSFAWSASSNCAENSLLSCFSTSFQEFSPLYALIIYPSFRMFLLLCAYSWHGREIWCWWDVGKMLRSLNVLPGSCKQEGVCLEVFGVFSCTVIENIISWHILQQHICTDKSAKRAFVLLVPFAGEVCLSTLLYLTSSLWRCILRFELFSSQT